MFVTVRAISNCTINTINAIDKVKFSTAPVAFDSYLKGRGISGCELVNQSK